MKTQESENTGKYCLCEVFKLFPQKYFVGYKYIRANLLIFYGSETPNVHVHKLTAVTLVNLHDISYR